MAIERVRYDRPRRPSRVTYLQMFSWQPCDISWPPQVSVERRSSLSADEYRALYNAVGADCQWTDRNRISDDDLLQRIGEAVILHVLLDAGALAGYCELKFNLPLDIELVYFGLVPAYRGRGLGKRFLQWTLNFAWHAQPQRVWLHTCDRDHRAALPNYQRAGFAVYDERWE